MAEWLPGVDCSNWQALTPQNARALAASGVQLVIVRLSHENQGLINTARAQCQMVVDAGMRLHGYPWCYFTESPEGAAQRVRDLYADLPIAHVWPDCEETHYVSTPGHNIDWLQRYLAVLEAQWPVGIYTGRWWWVPYMGNSTVCADLPLWDAEYTGAPALGMAAPYGGWTRRAIHQYSGNGSLAGISPLDLNAVDPALLEEADMTDAQMAEVQRIAREEVLRNVDLALANIDAALGYKRVPAGAQTSLIMARENLAAGARPATQTLARGLQPGEGDE